MNRRGHWTLVALCLIFIAPMLLAWYVYKHPKLLSGHTSQGQLLSPMVEFNSLNVTALDGAQQVWQKKWTVLYVTSLPCTKECQQIIYKMQQIRTATGKERQRVNRLVLFIADNQAQLSEKPSLIKLSQKEYAGTLLTFLPPDLWQQQAKPRVELNKLYLVDPLGNIMLSYPADVAPKAIFKDLQHLLRISQIG